MRTRSAAAVSVEGSLGRTWEGWVSPGRRDRSASLNFPGSGVTRRHGANMTQRQLRFEDYMQILAKRKWLLIVPTLVATLGGLLATFAFRPQYTSQALLLVVQQQVPEGLVKSIVTQELVERLANLEGRIQSRDRLLP